MEKENKKLKNFRLTDELIGELQAIAKKLNVSETEAIGKIIHMAYLQMFSEEKATMSGAIIPISEYNKVRDMLDQAFLKLGELQGKLEEKDKRIQEKDQLIAAKEDLIQEYKIRLDEITRNQNKKWWMWWK